MHALWDKYQEKNGQFSNSSTGNLQNCLQTAIHASKISGH